MAGGRIERPDFRDVRELRALAAESDRLLGRIVAEQQDRREELISLVGTLCDEQTEVILRDMSIDCLNAGKRGIRLSALRNAGIDNMLQLCAMSRRRIENIHGIGEDTARQIVELAAGVKRDVRAGVRPMLTPEDRSETATAILLALHRMLTVRNAAATAERLYGEYHTGIAAALESSVPAESGLRWFFASAEKKHAAAAAVGYLRERMTGAFARSVDEAFQGYSAYQPPDAEECWKDFERRAAAYYACLESIDRGTAERIDRSAGALPEKLVDEIERELIHTEGLKATLRGYQEFGVKYILHQGRVLLGDEMGLGKTVQAIAAMVSLASEGATHFMVVCPASVQVNWCREIRQFSSLGVISIRGGDFVAAERWQREGGVAVTTYESISRFALPEDFRFEMLIADEAHYVKNPLAKRTIYLRLLCRSAKRVLFMTGTPLENNVDEMCFIVSCLNAEVAEQLEEIKHISAAPQFREALSPVYLRRTREDVLTELPELIEKEQWCELGKEEGKRYLLSVMSGNFMAMRQVSWDVKDLADSSKAKRLLELCDMARDEGRKLIIFSFFRDTLDRVCVLLGDRATEPITGSVNSLRRQQIIDEFTDAPDGTALVCQIQAGGTGLNIQAASVIIFCEPQIKPSLETQAISRAYRMGQVRSVLVHRLLCDNTVDERILELLRDKQDVFDSFADVSAVGSEYMRREHSAVKDIIAAEKERLGIRKEDNPTE